MTPAPAPPPTEMFSHLLTAALGVGAGGGGLGVWRWLSDRSKAHAAAAPEMQKGMAALAQVVNDAAKMMFEELRKEVDDLRTRVVGLEAENEHCRGENRQAAQRIESLETMLRRGGIAVPDRLPVGTFITIEGDRTTVMTPVQDSR